MSHSAFDPSSSASIAGLHFDWYSFSSSSGNRSSSNNNSSRASYVRDDNLLGVVCDLFADHNDRELNGKVNNTASRIALHLHHNRLHNNNSQNPHSRSYRPLQLVLLVSVSNLGLLFIYVAGIGSQSDSLSAENEHLHRETSNL